MINYKIEEAKLSFAKDLAEIEKECFSEPWSEESLINAIENENAVILAAFDENKNVLGYAGFTFMFDEAEVTNIAVRKAYRGNGIGYELTKALIEKAKEENNISLILEVRESNSVAIGIYKKLGFKEIAVRKNFYEFPRENGISMINNF